MALGALFAALPQRIVHVELTGARWDGEELNVKTTNGNVNIETPNNNSRPILKISISEPGSNA